MVSLKWYGQACLSIENSVTIVTDPHDGESIGLKKPDIKGDIISISHRHFDHASGVDLVSRSDSEKAEGSGKRELKGIQVEGFESYHDKAQGSKRGKNTIFIFELDGFRICHLGDLGHKLSNEKASNMKPVDILIIPVGGNYTINASEAIDVIETLGPKIVLPIHYKVSGLKVDIDTDEEFVKLASERGWEVDKREVAEIENLPDRRKVIQLQCLA